MKAHLLILFFFALSATCVHAAEKRTTERDQAFVNEASKIFDYDRLMTLPPDVQADYVKYVRYMVMEMEENQKYLDQNSPARKAYVQNKLWLDALFSEALAAGNQKSLLQYIQPGKTHGCDYHVLPYLKRTVKHVVEGGSMLCAKANSIYAANCPAGYHRLGALNGQDICFIPRADVVRNNKKLADQQIEAARKRAEAKRLLAEKKAAARKLSQQRSVAQAKAKSAEAPSGETPVASQDAEQNETEGPQPPAEDDSHEVLKLPPYQLANELVTVIDADVDKDHECPAAPSPEKPETCTDQLIASGKSKFSRATSPHCLSAGNISHFRSPAKRAGACLIPREYCLDSITCRNADSSRTSNSKPQFSCGAGEAVCNPLLFDLAEDGKSAICVKADAHSTRSCNERATYVESEWKAKQTDKTVPYLHFINRISFVDANGGALHGAALIRRSWDDFAKSLNDLCYSSPSQDLYCEECAIMRRRAYDLNLASLQKKRASLRAPNAKQCFAFSLLCHGDDCGAKDAVQVKPVPSQTSGAVQ